MACARSLVRRARGTRLLSGYAAFLLRRLREAALCAPRAGGPRASGSLASCSPSGRGGPGPRLRRGPSTTAETPARSLSPGLQSSRARGGSGARSGSSLGRASKGVDGGRGKEGTGRAGAAAGQGPRGAVGGACRTPRDAALQLLGRAPEAHRFTVQGRAARWGGVGGAALTAHPAFCARKQGALGVAGPRGRPVLRVRGEDAGPGPTRNVARQHRSLPVARVARRGAQGLGALRGALCLRPPQ